VLLAVQMHEDLALEHVHRLVGVGMGVQGRHLALLHPVLEEQERPARLLGPDLPGVHTPAREPAALAFGSRPDKGARSGGGGGHGVFSLQILVMVLPYHDETDVP